MRIRLSTTHCKACSSKPRYTRAARRILTPRLREEHETLMAARAREAGPEFVAVRCQRASIEGNLSLWLRAMGLRRARYIGSAKTRLQHLVTAAPINLMRLAAWMRETPAAKTRRSAFARFMSSPAAPPEAFASSIISVALRRFVWMLSFEECRVP